MAGFIAQALIHTQLKQKLGIGSHLIGITSWLIWKPGLGSPLL